MSTWTTPPTGASARSSAPRRASPARPPCTSATATASRPTSTGRRRSATNGASTSRCSRRWPRAASTRSSLECIHSHVPPELMALLEGKDVMVGVIDVASDEVETPEEVADTIGAALRFVPRERLFPCTNCGMAPMDRAIAMAKLEALAKGAALAQRNDRHDVGRTQGAARRSAANVHGALKRDGHAVLSADALATLCGVRTQRLRRLDRRWNDLPPDRYLRDGGRYRRRRHACFVVARRAVAPVPHRRALAAAWNTTRCTAASSAGSSRSTADVVAQPALAARCSRRSAALRQPLHGRAALVRRGAPVPHRHRRRHRPADARRRAPRRRRLRRRDAGRRARASRAARRACSRPTARPACASRCTSRGPRCCSTTRA